MQYRKKPVVIEAELWDGTQPEVIDYPVEAVMHSVKTHCDVCGVSLLDHGWVKTLEGGHIVCPGDWIIKGVKGEFYPCKPDIFEATYEPV